MIRRGDVSTGWSLAWKINLWARMQAGNHCFRLLKDLLRPTGQTSVNMENGGGTYSNLLDAHPPFQIDGNFGGTAGIAEMLVQSQDGYIQFLPALPDQWAEGSFDGFCVRGGGVVSARWEYGKLKKATLKAKVNHTFKIRIPDGETCKAMVNGRSNQPAINNRIMNIRLQKGQTAYLDFK